MTEEWDDYCRSQAEPWLDHVRKLGVRVETMRAEVDALRDAAGVGSVCYDGLPRAKGSTDSAIPDAVASIQDAIAEYVAELRAYVIEQQEAHNALAAMADEAGHAALVRHYLLGWTWERCCRDMGYSMRGMMAVRRRALREAYDLMPARWRDPRHRAC